MSTTDYHHNLPNDTIDQWYKEFDTYLSNIASEMSVKEITALAILYLRKQPYWSDGMEAKLKFMDEANLEEYFFLILKGNFFDD